ncbi:MAG: hypothetical protein KVP17_002638 [Porospora cf. gigantea B]|uniref:uncharacterized protein n=1 Tax=Porospora cf. gigantea B TaxID=2853592 RepID=UPI003571AD83|nr:MAG: hypothetical protein KVP17_002638 [Porospora cf. gigantea B]
MRAMRYQQRYCSLERLRAVLLLPTSRMVESNAAAESKASRTRQWPGHFDVTFPIRTLCKQSPLTVSACRVCLETSRNCEHQKRRRYQFDQPLDDLTVTAKRGILLPTIPLPAEWSSLRELVTLLRPPCSEFWKPLPCQMECETRFQFPCSYFVRQSMVLPENFALTCQHTDRHNAGGALRLTLLEVREALGCSLPGVKFFIVTGVFFMLRVFQTNSPSICQIIVLLLLGLITVMCSHLARKVMLSSQPSKDFLQANEEVSKILNSMLVAASVVLIVTYLWMS